MNLVPVSNSSSIVAVGYEPATKELRVVYKGNRGYSYAGVSEEHGRLLIASADSDDVSTGKLVNGVIKNNYEFTALDSK